MKRSIGVLVAVLVAGCLGAQELGRLNPPAARIWRETVADVASLPLCDDRAADHHRVAADEQVLYRCVWDPGTATGEWVALSGGGESGAEGVIFPLLYARHEEPVGTNGGDASAELAWVKRTLDTVVYNSISGASLNASTSELTVPAGDFRVTAFGPVHAVLRHRLRLRSGATTTLCLGENSFAQSDPSQQSGVAILVCRISLAEPTELTLEQWIEEKDNASGIDFGVASGTVGSPGEPEVYTEVWIEQEAGVSPLVSNLGYDPRAQPPECELCEEYELGVETLNWEAGNWSTTTKSIFAGAAHATAPPASGNNIRAQWVDPPSGDWVLTASVTPHENSNFAAAGISVLASGTVASPTQLEHLYLRESGAVQWLQHTSYTATWAARVTLSSYLDPKPQAPCLQWRYVDSTKNLTAWYSGDCVHFTSTGVSHTLPGVPVKIGWSLNAENGSVGAGGTVHFFRSRTDADGLAGIVGTEVTLSGDTTPDILVVDETTGGASTASTWNDRGLDDLVVNGIGATLSTGDLIVPPGTYQVWATAACHRCLGHGLRLYDVGAAAPLLTGTGAWSYNSTGGDSTTTMLIGQLTLAEETTVRLQHWTDAAHVFAFNGAATAQLPVKARLVLHAGGAGYRAGAGGGGGSGDHPAVRVRKNPQQSIPSGGLHAVTFEVEDFDDAAFHDTSTNPSRITIPSGHAGRYLVGCGVDWEVPVGTGGVNTTLRIYLNGTTELATVREVDTGAAAIFRSQNVTTLYELAASDYLECRVAHDAGVSMNILASPPTQFWAEGR